MKKLLPAFLLSASFLLTGQAAYADVPPSPLDPAFKDAKTTQEAMKALMENPLFKAAVEEALKKKKETEAERKKLPIGPNPAAAARIRFLEVLQNPPKGVGEKK